MDQNTSITQHLQNQQESQQQIEQPDDDLLNPAMMEDLQVELKRLEEEETMLKDKLQNNRQKDKDYLEQIKSIYNDDLDILEISNRTSIEDINQDIRYLVKDNDTGQNYNIQDIQQNNYDQIKADTQQQNEWQEYWQKIKALNNSFIDSVETNNLIKLRKIMNNEEYPIQIDKPLDIDNQTALHLATNDGNIDIVKILLHHQADPNLSNKKKQNVMHLVARRGNLKIAQLLVNNYVDINQQDQDLNTPLHIACEYGNFKVVQLLCEQKNVQLDTRNQYNQRPIDLVYNQDILELLQGLGQQIDVNYGKYQLGQQLINRSRNQQVQNIMNISKQQYINVQQKKKYQQVLVQTENDDKSVYQRIKRKLKSLIGKQQVEDPNIISLKQFIFYRQLGKGSFGEVYLVRCLRDNELYAMKILQKQRVIQSNQIRYAQTEKNVLQIMKHPFIVSLNYAFQTKHKLIMVMDYCPKGDLSKLLKYYIRVPEKYAKVYIGEILLALEALHDESIVFRDLKPENVVLDENGHAMLTDFGLSKQGVKNNISRSFCGSLAYLAPEMLYRVGHSRMVDWYLLGVLMYELIIGITPYYSSNKEQLFQNIKTGPLMLPKSVSDEAKSLLKQLLCRNPAKRLGANNDASDIKQHPFFEGIDWNKLYRKEYEVLAINYLPVHTELIPDKQLMKLNKDKNDRNKVDNWTFIQPK